MAKQPQWLSTVKYQDPRTRTYLGSPSILRLPDGALLATHDYFGRGCPVNHVGEQHLTSVYRSEDDGHSWWNVTHISGAFWSGLFIHRGTVYLLGTSAQYGDIVIRRSDNGGFTWTHPKDDSSGLLFRGGHYHDPPNYHCAPVPVLFSSGRIYRAFEDCDPLIWGKGFRAFVISADEDADLLDARTWRMTNKLPYDPETYPPDSNAIDRNACGWLEGNMVEAPDGTLWDILRFNSVPVLNKAAMVRVVDEGARVEFDPETGFIDLPGGLSKFTIRRDPVGGRYWMLSNDMQDFPVPIRRNRLSLFSSADLRAWEKHATLMVDDHEKTPEDSVRNTGFQYVDWQFDRDDIIYLVRTAYDGAHNFHDSNRIVCAKVKAFRKLAEKKEVSG